MLTNLEGAIQLQYTKRPWTLGATVDSGVEYGRVQQVSSLAKSTTRNIGFAGHRTCKNKIGEALGGTSHRPHTPTQKISENLPMVRYEDHPASP